jgi:hypothetical protein
MVRIALPFLILSAALVVAAADTEKKKAPSEPKSFAEKERIAADMKKIARQLDVKCEYCHTDAERGLKEGDYTLLTKEGEYAHEEMFPMSEKFKVECSHCHAGGSDMTAAGERAHKDMKFIKRYKREQKKILTCASCHIPGEKGREFAVFTEQAKKLDAR